MDNLDNIAEHDRKHFAQCVECGQYFDCRDLTQVAEHFHDSEPLSPITFASSRRVNEPIDYLAGKVRVDCN